MLYGTFNYLPRKYFRMETFRLLVLLICCGAAATTDIRTAGTFGDVGDWSPTIFFGDKLTLFQLRMGRGQIMPTKIF